ncbi:hypothetical protein [Pseudomonas sp. NPDC007930]|uniref:hypothetical protein n=1 Tax=Pseudomonas sp. NPDC007930 TaxID=3364417 RepID=UPI0036E21822
MKRLMGLCLCLLGVFGTCATMAATVRLAYNPRTVDALKIVDAPYSSYCALRRCASNEGSQTLFKYDRTVTLGTPDTSRHFSMQMPGQRTLRLTSGSASVELKVEMFALHLRPYPSAQTGMGANPFQGNMAAGCNQDYYYLGSNYLGVIWKPNSAENTSHCRIDTASMAYRTWTADVEAGPAYRLSIAGYPRLPAGVYTGSLVYHVTNGAGPDFDVGRNSSVHDYSFTLNFEMTVERDLQAGFTEPVDTLELLPAGGWDSWAPGSRPPVLRARAPFSVTTNAPFRVSYRCATLADDGRCALGTFSNHTRAPFTITLNWDNAPPLAPGYPAEGQPNGQGRTFGYAASMGRYPGVFNFVMDDSSPLFTARGKQWSGDVTVVFDTQL